MNEAVKKSMDNFNSKLTFAHLYTHKDKQKNVNFCHTGVNVNKI